MQISEIITESTNQYDPKVKQWIDKVYSLYPSKWNGYHLMVWGEGDDQTFAMFDLEPSPLKKDAVEIKWFQAYPLRSGVGTKAMLELQRLAKEDNVPLTLYPWDKGRVSQANLKKFYKSLGFTPFTKTSNNMIWVPQSI